MKKFLVFSFAVFVFVAQAQNKFEIDLRQCSSDVLTVSYSLTAAPASDQVRFYFPATVPGTYSTLNYGRFIKSFQALDEGGKALPVKKEGTTAYSITGAKGLSRIIYTVEDIMDQSVKKDPIFQPASTNFDCNKNFFLNNGAIFGFIEGEEGKPLVIDIKKPETLYGASSLPLVASSPESQRFTARDYHQLVDCPIMFSKPDTAQFYVNTTKVTISVFDVQGKPRARQFYQALKRDMEAIAAVLPALPVEDYTFIIFVDDHRELGKAINGKMGFFKKLRLAMEYRNFGVGALEHGNSSTYYLADLGDVNIPEASLENQLTEAAIHEFMHIVTPLGLHSQLLGNFNYISPKMSKHLWLYEGVTEYLAKYIKYKGGVYDEAEFLSTMSKKFAEGVKFPVTEMSFTEMSANVLEKKYYDQYLQVYDRGAALAMLLDGEIRRLTQGQKTLLDVVLVLNARYGAEKSFDEDSFFDEFSAEVHPELRKFFSNYVEGKNVWQPSAQLAGMGYEYHEKLSERGALNPFSPTENDIKRKSMGMQIKITEVGVGEWAGLKKGDVVRYSDYARVFAGTLPEGTIVRMPVERGGSAIELPITVKYGDKSRTHVLVKK